MTTARLPGRVAGVPQAPVFSFLLAGTGSCWSGCLRERADAPPRGGDRLGPRPGGLYFQAPSASAADQPGRGVQDPVASLNLEMIMVLGGADGGLRRA